MPVPTPRGCTQIHGALQVWPPRSVDVHTLADDAYRSDGYTTQPLIVIVEGADREGSEPIGAVPRQGEEQAGPRRGVHCTAVLAGGTSLCLTSANSIRTPLRCLAGPVTESAAGASKGLIP